MHVSTNGVRLAALVAAATASGYLWRAALEPAHTPTIIRLAPPVTPAEVPIQAVHRPASAQRAVPRRVRPLVTIRHRSRSVTHVVEHTAAPASHTYVTAATHPASKPIASPKPKPKPAPKPSTSPPARPAQSPAPAEGATVSAPPPPSAPTESEATPGSKPGWGHGDKNHDHDGPQGKHG